MQKYLITHGADSDMTTWDADDHDHAIDQFIDCGDFGGREDITDVALIIPVLDWNSAVGNDLGGPFDHIGIAKEFASLLDDALKPAQPYTQCDICGAPATLLAPQDDSYEKHVVPGSLFKWVAVCASHADGWFDGSDFPNGVGAPPLVTIPEITK